MFSNIYIYIYMYIYAHFLCIYPSISPLNVAGKMMFLLHRWDMTVPRRVRNDPKSVSSERDDINSFEA